MPDAKTRELGLTPLARVVVVGVLALSPEIIGYGPVERRWPELGWCQG
jgi:acetyl-CoA C-acetyltransferase